MLTPAQRNSLSNSFNRWYRQKRSRADDDHFHRGVRMTYNRRLRGGGVSLRAHAAFRCRRALFCSQRDRGQITADVLGLKIAWLGIVVWRPCATAGVPRICRRHRRWPAQIRPAGTRDADELAGNPSATKSRRQHSNFQRQPQAKLTMSLSYERLAGFSGNGVSIWPPRCSGNLVYTRRISTQTQNLPAANQIALAKVALAKFREGKTDA